MGRSRSSFPNARSEHESSLVGKIGKHRLYYMRTDSGLERADGV